MATASHEDGLILTIDMGTSSVRTIVFDRGLQAVPGTLARRSIDVHTDQHGAAELDADALFTALCLCLDETLSLLGPRTAKLVAVAGATMATTMVAVDADARPVGPLRTYADTRSDAVATELRATLDERTVHARTGCMLRPNYWPARLRWLQTAYAAEWAATAHVWTLGALVCARLTGVPCVTHSEASWTGLLNRQTLEWDSVWLATLTVDSATLPRVHDVDIPLPPLLTHWAARWPALARIPWYGLIGDGAAANVGSGCVDAGQLALTIGTTGAVRIAVAGTPLPPFGLWCYRIDRQTALLGGATSEGGNVYQWLRDTVRYDGDDAALEAAIAACAPDSHGLTMLPLFAGERSPGWAGDARATIHGMHLGTTPVELFRAGYEAIALRIGQIAALVPRTDRVVASGGALEHSAAWLQICADVLGRPVETTDVREATCRGVAVLTMARHGWCTLQQTKPHTQRVFVPNPAATQQYARAALRQHALYRRVLEEWETRSADDDATLASS